MQRGTVTINVKGEGSFMLAAGRPDDVDAWVGKTAHNTVSGVSEDGKALQLTHADGEATAPSPAGSDLWVTTENASGELKYTWTPPADGDWSLLLADGRHQAGPELDHHDLPERHLHAVGHSAHGPRRPADPRRRRAAGPQAQVRHPSRRRQRGSSGDSTGGSPFARRAQAKAAARSEARKSAAATAAVPVVESPAADPGRDPGHRPAPSPRAAEKTVAAPRQRERSGCGAPERSWPC